MTMRTEFDGEAFQWQYDSLYGVGQFVRKSDGATAYLETGTDCQDVRRTLRRTQQRTSSPRYSALAPSFPVLLDSLALEYEYHE